MGESMNAHSPWHVCVLIPARNEEALLPRCLDSVLKAVESVARYATTDIIVAADRCTDLTFPIAEARLRCTGTVVPVNAGAAGGARAQAARVALSRLRGSPSHCWIANTDADCIVPPHWLIDQLLLANLGVEAIAGTVAVDTFNEHGPEVESSFRASYTIHADGSHPHVHGANMGVRADVYLEAGGWSHLETAEDHDLWNRLARDGRRRLSTSRIEVVTSGRRVGRAPHGFAGALASHNEKAA